MDTTEKGGDVDGVECLGEVHCYRHRPSRRAVLIEAADHLVGQRKKSRDAGALTPETMLGVGEVQMR